MKGTIFQSTTASVQGNAVVSVGMDRVLLCTGCQGTPLLQHQYLDSSYQERKTNSTNISMEVIIPFKGDSRNLLNLEIVMSSSAERVWET